MPGEVNRRTGSAQLAFLEHPDLHSPGDPSDKVADHKEKKSRPIIACDAGRLQNGRHKWGEEAIESGEEGGKESGEEGSKEGKKAKYKS